AHRHAGVLHQRPSRLGRAALRGVQVRDRRRALQEVSDRGVTRRTRTERGPGDAGAFFRDAGPSRGSLSPCGERAPPRFVVEVPLKQSLPLFVLLASLSACGGGEAAAEPAAEPAATTAGDEKKSDAPEPEASDARREL